MLEVFNMCLVKSIIFADIHNTLIPKVLTSGRIVLFQTLIYIFCFANINNPFIIGIVPAKQKVYTTRSKIFSITTSFYINAWNFICLSIPVG